MELGGGQDGATPCEDNAPALALYLIFKTTHGFFPFPGTVDNFAPR